MSRSSRSSPFLEPVRNAIRVRHYSLRRFIPFHGKRHPWEVVTLPEGLVVPLQRHLEAVRMIHDKDLAEGYGAVYLPFALARKYPNAPRQWARRYVFPASKRSPGPYSGVERGPPCRRR